MNSMTLSSVNRTTGGSVNGVRQVVKNFKNDHLFGIPLTTTIQGGRPMCAYFAVPSCVPWPSLVARAALNAISVA
jgi:hypothetical protein